MQREFAATFAFLLLSLGLAYRASLPQQDREATKEWFSADAASISEISYRTPTKTVTAKAQGAPGQFWLAVAELPAAPTLSPTPSPSASPVAAAMAKTYEFKGSERIAEVLNALKPLQALRVIGKAADLSIKDFGFDEAPTSFSVTTVKGDKLELRLGKKGYGSRNVFAIDDKAGDVIILDATIFDSLSGALTELYERRIIDQDWLDIKKLEVFALGKEKSLVQAERDQSGLPNWRDDVEGAVAKPTYKSWVDNLTKIRVQRFATMAEATTISSMQPFLEVGLWLGTDKEHDRLVFRKLDAGAVAAEKDVSFWLSSSFLGAPVKISMNRLATFEGDIASIVGQ